MKSVFSRKYGKVYRNVNIDGGLDHTGHQWHQEAESISRNEPVASDPARIIGATPAPQI
jgi:hypothetical protein